MCMNETDWNKFKRGELAVNCRTKKEAKEFVEECFNEGVNVNWLDIPNYRIYYSIYGEDITYDLHCGNLQISHIAWCKAQGLPVVKYTPKNEFTFKELLTMDKSGIYEACEDLGGTHNIDKLILTNGDVYIKTGILNQPVQISIPKELKFKICTPKNECNLVELEHKVGGKIYTFVADKEENIKIGDFVICDTTHGETFGRVTNIINTELTEAEYNLYKKCWLA